MIQDWLAYPWDEVRSELDSRKLDYTFRFTQPHRKVEAIGEARVVRIRMTGERLEFILASELAKSPELTP